MFPHWFLILYIHKSTTTVGLHWELEGCGSAFSFKTLFWGHFSLSWQIVELERKHGKREGDDMQQSCSARIKPGTSQLNVRLVTAGKSGRPEKISFDLKTTVQAAWCSQYLWFKLFMWLFMMIQNKTKLCELLHLHYSTIQSATKRTKIPHKNRAWGLKYYLEKHLKSKKLFISYIAETPDSWNLGTRRRWLFSTGGK